MSWFQVAFIAAEVIFSLLTKHKTAGGQKLKEFQVSTSAYSRMWPFGYGTFRIGGQMIWAEPFKQHAQKSKGKGQAETYTYTDTFAMGFCEGVVDQIITIWADGRVVYDARGLPVNQNLGDQPPGSIKRKKQTTIQNFDFRIYYGDESQTADPAIMANPDGLNSGLDPSFAPAFRGLCYIVFDNIDITKFGNRIPNFNVLVTTSGAADFTLNRFTTTFGSPQNGALLLDNSRSRLINFPAVVDDQTGANVFDLTSLAETEYDITNAVMVLQDLNPEDGNVFGIGLPYTLNEADGGTYSLVTSFTPDSGDGNLTRWGRDSGHVYLFYENSGVPYSNAEGGLSGTLGIDSILGIATVKISGDTDSRIIYAGQPTAGTTEPINLYQFDAGAKTLLATVLPSDIDASWTDWSFVNTTGQIIFDTSDGNVMVFFNNGSQINLVKFDRSTGDIIWNIPSIPKPPTNGYSTQYANVAGSGKFVYGSNDAGDSIVIVYTASGSYDASLSIAPNDSFDPDASQIYDPTYGVLYFNDTANTCEGAILPAELIVTTGPGGGVLLSDVVTNLCERVGPTAGDIDVTSLAGIFVTGYTITAQQTIADSLAALALAYSFDVTESDNKLKFVLRGSESIVTIPANKLALVKEGKDGYQTSFQDTRAHDLELPKSLGVTYIDPNIDYQSNIQIAQRTFAPIPSMWSHDYQTQSFDMTFDPDEALSIAQIILYTAWMERIKGKFQTTWEYLPYDPTDVIMVELADATTYPLRITEADVGANWTVDMTGATENGITFQPSGQPGTSGGGGGGTGGGGTSFATIQQMILDSPLLNDGLSAGATSSVMMFCGGVFGDITTFPGAGEFKSLDDATYTMVGVALAGVTWGYCSSPLGSVDNPNITDDTNTLHVSMQSGEDNIAGTTQASMLNGTNQALIWNLTTGVIEVIGFRDVLPDDIGNGFTLSGFLRGRRGTEEFVGTHGTGEIFILVDFGAIKTFDNTLSDLHQTRYYKLVPTGATLEEVTAIEYASQERDLMPYAPVHVTATVSGSDIDLAWVRRTRLGGPLMDGTGTVPLSEASEAYEVDIYDGPDLATVLRTLTGIASPSAVYLAADITTDFGSIPATLTLGVYQISESVGRGFVDIVTVPVE